MTPFPYLGLKAPTPNMIDVRFTFHTWRAVQSAIADLLVSPANAVGNAFSRVCLSTCLFVYLSVLFML